MPENTKVGFIGAGQMATALASGMLAKGVCQASDVSVYDPDSAATNRFLQLHAGSQSLASSAELAGSATTIVLAVKPHIVPMVADSIGNELSSDRLLVSIAAGVKLAKLSELFQTQRIIRVMPNTPCMVGEGASAFCSGDAATEPDIAWVHQVLSSVGVCHQVAEPLLDAVTGLSGSGPAFVYTMIEALADGGVRAGLPRKVAISLAAQTVRGAATMVQQSDVHSAELKDRVASPGGTTIAGLHALEVGGLRAALMNAVAAAAKKSMELGE